MKVSEILETSRKAFPSLEIVPPLKGMTKEKLNETIRPFMEFSPKYINITSHRDEFEFVQNPDGTFTRHLVRNRISETTVAAALMAAYPDVEIVPHLICGGVTKDEILSKLDNLKFLGISNILALRGDSLAGEKRFTPTPGGLSHASELVETIRAYRNLAVDSSSPEERWYCIGVGGYPEKHFEAPNIETDIANLKRKVDAGADYVITQMFFDNAVFYDFVKRCREAGITCPILPGLKPISTHRQVLSLPEAFSLDIPVELTDAISAASRPQLQSGPAGTVRTDPAKAVYQIGQEWCMMQCRDLIAHGVPAVHFYTMGKTENIVNILRNLF